MSTAKGEAPLPLEKRESGAHVGFGATKGNVVQIGAKLYSGKPRGGVNQNGVQNQGKEETAKEGALPSSAPGKKGCYERLFLKDAKLRRAAVLEIKQPR